MVILEACEGWDWEEAGAEHPAEAHGVVSHLGGTRRVTTAPPPPEVDSTGASEAEGSGPQWWGPERDSNVSTTKSGQLCKRFSFWCFFLFFRLLKSFRPHKPWTHFCLVGVGVAQIIQGGKERGRWGGES